MGIHNCSFHQFDKINTFGLVCVVLSRAFMKVSWIHRFAIDAKNHRRFFFKSSLQVWCDLGVGWNIDKYFFTLIEHKGNNLFMEKWVLKVLLSLLLIEEYFKSKNDSCFSLRFDRSRVGWLPMARGTFTTNQQKRRNKKDKTRNCPLQFSILNFWGLSDRKRKKDWDAFFCFGFASSSSAASRWWRFSFFFFCF